MDVETKDLGEGVQAIILKQGVFPFHGDETKVLFVRECIRTIADSIVECRKKKNSTKSAAIIGQPGIGKSYGLFYLAHRFLQEDDVEAVVLESSANGEFHFFFRKRSVIPFVCLTRFYKRNSVRFSFFYFTSSF